MAKELTTKRVDGGYMLTVTNGRSNKRFSLVPLEDEKSWWLRFYEDFRSGSMSCAGEYPTMSAAKKAALSYDDL